MCTASLARRAALLGALALIAACGNPANSADAASADAATGSGEVAVVQQDGAVGF